MTFMDQSRMATPPAPQPPSLVRLRKISVALCLASAVCVAGIRGIRMISVYAVIPVALIMLAAVITLAVYWYWRSKLEAAYWTPEREAEHVESVVRSIHTRRATGRGRGISLARPSSRPAKWWQPR